MSLAWVGQRQLAARRDLVAWGSYHGVPIKVHHALEPYFQAHPLALKTVGLGRWRWLTLDTDQDVGLEIHAQSYRMRRALTSADQS